MSALHPPEGPTRTAAPLFASTELAARIEAAECGLLREAVAGVSLSRPDAETYVRDIAGGVATWAGPDSPFDKVAGLGFGGPVSEDLLAEIEEAFAARGSPVQVELSTLADPSVGALLTARGYRLVAFENVLGRALPVSSDEGRLASGASVRVSRSDERGFSTWLDAVVTGFLHPDGDGIPPHESFARETLERVMGDMARAEGFAQYVAHIGDEVAGGATLRMDRGVAQLAGAATLPAHRRRGVQAALLARRLADAAEAGCDVAVVTTQPGSASMRNVQRTGFDLLYARAILVRAREPG